MSLHHPLHTFLDLLLKTGVGDSLPYSTLHLLHHLIAFLLHTLDVPVQVVHFCPHVLKLQLLFLDAELLRLLLEHLFDQDASVLTSGLQLITLDDSGGTCSCSCRYIFWVRFVSFRIVVSRYSSRFWTELHSLYRGRRTRVKIPHRRRGRWRL